MATLTIRSVEHWRILVHLSRADRPVPAEKLCDYLGVADEDLFGLFNEGLVVITINGGAVDPGQAKRRWRFALAVLTGAGRELARRLVDFTGVLDFLGRRAVPPKVALVMKASGLDHSELSEMDGRGLIEAVDAKNEPTAVPLAEIPPRGLAATFLRITNFGRRYLTPA